MVSLVKKPNVHNTKQTKILQPKKLDLAKKHIAKTSRLQTLLISSRSLKFNFIQIQTNLSNQIKLNIIICEHSLRVTNRLGGTVVADDEGDAMVGDKKLKS